MGSNCSCENKNEDFEVENAVNVEVHSDLDAKLDLSVNNQTITKKAPSKGRSAFADQRVDSGGNSVNTIMSLKHDTVMSIGLKDNDGLINGFGILKYANGNELIGYFKANKLVGFGIKRKANGSTFFGYFGEQYYPFCKTTSNSKGFLGECDKQIGNGVGVEWYADESHFVGRFDNGRRTLG